MELQRAQERLRTLVGHLGAASEKRAAEHALRFEVCRAEVLFGRPALPGTLYSRPAAAAPSTHDLEALGAATAALARAVQAAAAEAPTQQAPGSTQQPPAVIQEYSSSSTASGALETLAGQGWAADRPRYARPIEAAQPRTSPFAPSTPASLPETTSLAAAAVPQPAGLLAATEAVEPSSISGPDAAGLTGWRPQVDVFRTQYGWVYDVALPGVRPEDLRAELVGRRLLVSGRRSATLAGNGASRSGSGLLPDLVALLPTVFGLPTVAAGPRASEQQRQQVGPPLLLQPQGQVEGVFAAEWQLPDSADPDSLRAVFKEGVLRIRVSRRGVLTRA